MAWVCYFRNDLEKALNHATIALRHAKRVNSADGVLEASTLLSFIYLAEGETKKADQCVQRIHSVSRATGNPSLIAFADATVAYHSVARGDLGWAEQWSDQRNLQMDEPFSIPFVFECLAQAGLLYRCGRYQEAANTLEAFRDRCMNENMREAVLEVDFLHSATLYALNERGRAWAIIKQALSFAETEGYIRYVVAYAPIISRITNDVAGNQLEGQWFSRVTANVKARGIGTACMPNQSETIGRGSLTRREIEILKLLAAGYRYREIAEKAFVSLPTIKTHTTHIYEKLNVRTRDQAIRRAQELRFLDNL